MNRPRQKAYNGRLLLLALFMLSACVQGRQVDWGAAPKVQRGVRLVSFKKEVPREKPLSQEAVNAKRKELEGKKLSKEIVEGYKAESRPMRVNVMRIDLRIAGLKFTGTGRTDGWGEKMPDHATEIIRTKRQRTADFMAECRKPASEGGRGLDMIVACNSAPWLPWEPPYTHKFGNPVGLEISDGIVIADNPNTTNAFFVVYKNGKIDIADKIEANPNDEKAKYGNVSLVATGFEIIMKNGSKTPQAAGGYSAPLMPRMAFGLDKDKSHLFIVTVDGRLPGWSEGANGEDLFRIVKDAGAWDAINMDGGGSTTLCYWDSAKKTVRTVNRHGYAPNGYFRPCGMNMGLYIRP